MVWRRCIKAWAVHAEEKYGVSLKKRKTFIKDTVAECTQSKQDAPEVRSILRTP